MRGWGRGWEERKPPVAKKKNGKHIPVDAQQQIWKVTVEQEPLAFFSQDGVDHGHLVIYHDVIFAARDATCQPHSQRTNHTNGHSIKHQSHTRHMASATTQ